MKTDILYSFRRCPYAIRVRWALLICEIKLEIREVDLKNKPFDFVNKSRTKTVPLLLKKDNEIIEESLDIIIWALSESDKKNIKDFYFPDSKEEEILEVIYDNDQNFKFHLDRFKYSMRYNSLEEDYHFFESFKFIKKWNKLIREKEWLVGDNPSIADWCIWPFVRQFKIACKIQKKRSYLEDPIRKWLEYFENHKNFEKLMFKYQLWKPSDKKDYFPC